MNPTEQTRAAYNQIAATYQIANQNRTAVSDQLEKFIAALPAQARVLDLGSGPGFDTALLRQRGLRTVGLDLSWEMLRVGQANYAVPLVQADLRHIPVAQVDGVWACASLLHLSPEDMPAALQEISRVLLPGGVFYLSVKWGEGVTWKEASYGQKAPRFFAHWTPPTLDPLLMKAGFTIFDGWQQTGSRDTWLVRFARKTT